MTYCLLLLAATVNAQNYPDKPIRLLVGYAAGGGADTLARILAGPLGELLGQQILVENRPGAGSTIAAAAVAKSAPDGYTLYYAEAAFLTAPSLLGDLPYDSVRSFAPVSGTVSLPLAIVVNLSVPAKTPQELIALIKANPGKFNYGTPGVGTLHHLIGELLKKTTGIEWTHVPYKGAAAVLPDVIGGQIPVGIVSATAGLAQARGGKLRIVALTSPKRLPSAPEYPVLAEAVAGLDVSTDLFVLAPAGTPTPVVAALNKALRTVLGRKEVLDNIQVQGGTVDWTTPEDLGAKISRDIAKWTAVVKEARIRIER
jgi:tripartite-type tricarboxylate transporter receptor subunit TctC